MIRRRQPLARTPMPPRTTPLRRNGWPTQSPVERDETPSPSRSTGLSRGPIKARRTPVTAEERRGRRLVRLRSEGWCEIRLPGCGNAGSEWSHRIARGRGGSWDASNGLAACRSCHHLITDTQGHRAEYERLGYLVRTGLDTTSIPVRLYGDRWVLLTDTGEFVPIRDCTKARYRTEDQAQQALSRIWQHPIHGAGVMPTRAYRCPQCGGWHLTSMTLDDYEATAVAGKDSDHG